MAIKNIYNTEISAPSFTWNGNTIATQAWVNANVGTPTLDSVTTSGSVTTNNLSVGSLNVTGGTIVSGIDTRTDVGIAIAKGDYLTSNDGSYIRNLIGLNSSSNIEIGQSGTSLISNIQLKPGANGNIQFYASGSEDVRINSSGNVGIGTTSPAQKLDVNGVIAATGGNSTNWNTAYGWGNHAGLYLGVNSKAADSNLLDGIDSTGFTRQFTFDAGSSGGSRRYVKLFTLDDFDDSVVGILSSSGDFGDPTRATYQINIGTRTSLDFKVFKMESGAVADDWEFYYKQDASNNYEIWALLADYNQQVSFTRLSSYGLVIYNFDSVTTTAPTGLTQVTVEKIFHDSYHPNADRLTTARNIALSGAVTGNANFDGSGNITIATTATSDPTLTLAGDATGSATFTNLGNATLTVTVADDSHNHVISNIDGLQTALDGKASSSHTHTDADINSWHNRETVNIDTYNPDSNWSTSIATSTSYGTQPSNYTNIHNLGGDGVDFQTQIATYYGNNNRMWVRSRYDGTNAWVGWNEVWTSGSFANNSANWNTAYGWGDHAAAGYLTSYTETDTLATVVARGAFFGTTNQGYVDSGGTYGTNLRKISRITLTHGGSNWNSDSHAILSKGLSGADADSISINSYNGIHLRLDSNNNNANNTTNFTIHNDTTTSSNELFRITGDGNVGIGTTSPAQKLHVEGGSVYATGGTSNAKYISLFVNDSWGYLQTDAAKFYLNQELRVDTGLIGSYNEDLQLRTSAVTRMTINNTSGNVGIGTTSPGYTLDVNGSMHSTNITIADGIYHEGDTNTIISFGTDTINLSTGGGVRATINNSGAKFNNDVVVVGGATLSLGERGEPDDLGRTILLEGAANAANGEGSGRIFFSEHNSTTASADNYGLSLYYEGDPNIALPSGFQPNQGNGTWSLRRHNNSVNGDYIMSGSRTNSDVTFWGNLTVPNTIYHQDDANTYMQFPANDTWIVATSGSERLRVTSAGNVGIGASSPSEKLQVGTGSLDDRIRVYYSDGTYSEQTGWGMEFARNTSYLRPNNNNIRTLYIGNSGKAWSGVNVESTNFTWNSNAVATQSWVTSQGYSTSSATVYTPDVYEWAQNVYGSNAPIDIGGQMVNGTTTTSQISPSEIQFTAAGTYMISWSLNWESLYNNRSVFGAGAYLNGFIIPGSSNLQYFRYNTYGHASTTNATFSVQVAAGDVISWRTLLHSGAANHATTPIGGDMGAITIHRIA